MITTASRNTAVRRALPNVRAVAVDLNLYQGGIPTPTLPSGPMMAQFLLAYKRMLEHETPTGDSAAEYGESVLERVKVGLQGLLHHPQHGAYAGPAWRREEQELEACLKDLEEDVHMFYKYHGKKPSKMLVQLSVLHCIEAAGLLSHL